MNKVLTLSVRATKRTMIVFILAFLFLFPAVASAGTDNLRVMTASGLGSPIPVYSDSKIDVYIDQDTIQAVIAHPETYNKTGNFLANLYFVYKDESERQDVIKKIRERREEEQRERRKKVKKMGATHATLPKRPHVPDDLKPGGKLDDLKYVMLFVQYFKGPLTVIGGGASGPVNASTLSILQSVYNAPYQESGYDIILADRCNTTNKAYIGQDRSWNIISGSIHLPGTDICSFKLEKEKYPLLYQIIQNVIQKINDAEKKVREEK
jgi:hypothetical protein